MVRDNHIRLSDEEYSSLMLIHDHIHGAESTTVAVGETVNHLRKFWLMETQSMAVDEENDVVVKLFNDG